MLSGMDGLSEVSTGCLLDELGWAAVGGMVDCHSKGDVGSCSGTGIVG